MGELPTYLPYISPTSPLYLPMYLLLEVPDRVLVGELQLLELELKRPLVLVRDRVRDRVRVGVMDRDRDRARVGVRVRVRVRVRGTFQKSPPPEMTNILEPGSMWSAMKAHLVRVRVRVRAMKAHLVRVRVRG